MPWNDKEKKDFERAKESLKKELSEPEVHEIAAELNVKVADLYPVHDFAMSNIKVWKRLPKPMGIFYLQMISP